MNAVVKTEQKSILIAMADRYGMMPEAFEQTLRATVVPPKTTREEFAAFLLVAKEYKLNPILKEIYAFPKQGGGIQPIIGVDGWVKMINSHPECDGFNFVDQFNEETGDLMAVICEIYRKDRSQPTVAIEYMDECKRNTPSWNQWPRRMLRHKALIQAARYAFGFSGVVEPDEYERETEAEPAKRPTKVVRGGSNKPLPPVAGRYAEENHATDQEQAVDVETVRAEEGNEDLSRQPEQGDDKGSGPGKVTWKTEKLVLWLQGAALPLLIEASFFSYGMFMG